MKHQDYSRKLWEAEIKHTPIPSFSADFNGALPDAYKIQAETANTRIKAGEKLVGYKIGLTSLEAQKHFGITHPDFGHLFESMRLENGAVCPTEKLIAPKVEAEIAFIMGSDLKGPGVTVDQAKDAVESVVGALEIIDSRFEKWKINAFDTIADNGSSCRFVLGNRRLSLKEVDLPFIGMALSKDDEVMLTACGAAVMGNPLEALCFLANELSKFGRHLEEGHVVLSGSLGGMISMEKGVTYSAELLGLGKVSVQ